jgi:hypothetical protein
MRNTPVASLLFSLFTALGLAACGQASDDHDHDHGHDHGHVATAQEDSLPTGPVASPEGAEVYFIEPADGATLSNPVVVKFGLRGMGIAPAGIHLGNTGHHHLLINVEAFATDRPLPTDDQHRHFGGGQTEASLELPAGTHTLQLVFGDWKHQPHDPVVQSDIITITVE